MYGPGFATVSICRSCVKMQMGRGGVAAGDTLAHAHAHTHTHPSHVLRCVSGEMGRRWYEDGKYLKKKNTFTDFIACAEYLIEARWTKRDALCIEGRSAGGLTMGAVLNARPDLFSAAILGVSGSCALYLGLMGLMSL
jgi:Prolyl oligopeptidase family